MRGAVTLIFALTSLCVCAQTERCSFEAGKSQEQFERWMVSKQATARTQGPTVYKIPVVVHILHDGENVGEGFNFSKDRVVDQIKTLNEDFRRMEGTPGFNDHPDGDDARIEFVLAQTDPGGNTTDGIARVNMKSVQIDPRPGDIIGTCSQYSYWDPDRYLNVWCMPMGIPPGLFLGSGRFPVTDLEGGEDWKDPPEGDGVFINALNFGKGDTLTDPNFDKGRTLTHEIGHFLGLLHTFGSINNSRQCDAYTDYCNDTPPTPVATAGCDSAKPTACDGRPVMLENYMDGSYDVCMNIFTRNQITRMRTVLENSPRRKSLTTSPVIDRKVITGVDDPGSPLVTLYPNPATDKVYITIPGSEDDVRITGYTLTGQILFRHSDIAPGIDYELSLGDVQSKLIVIVVEVNGGSYKFPTYLSGR